MSTSGVSTSSSIAITSTSTSSHSSTPSPTDQTSDPNSSSKGNTWIAGVVVGPLVGIALGAVLMWFCLRKRKNEKAQQTQGQEYDQVGYHQQHPAGQDPKEGYHETVANHPQQWQHQAGNHDQYIVEAPGSTIPKEPAELWQGNYKT
jgi:hypothetical protein